MQYRTLKSGGDSIRIFVLIALIAILAAGPALAQSGEELLPACRKAAHGDIDLDEPVFDLGVCTGIVSATLGFGRSSLVDQRYRVCPPEGATTVKALWIVVDFLERRPDLLHQDLRVSALAALTTAWPCK